MAHQYEEVDSVWIQGLKQVGDNRVRMRTLSGAVYEYRGTEQLFNSWLRSGSKGMYFHQQDIADRLIRRVY